MSDELLAGDALDRWRSAECLWLGDSCDQGPFAEAFQRHVGRSLDQSSHLALFDLRDWMLYVYADGFMVRRANSVPPEIRRHHFGKLRTSELPKTVELATDQQAIEDWALNSEPKSIALMTGAAGTGKSFIINYLRQRFKGVGVCAMTGTAAQLIRGATFHSLVDLNWRNNQATLKITSDERMRGLELLIIDEISMATLQQLRGLGDRFKQAGHQPRVLLSGDLMQLGPVIKQGEQNVTPIWDVLPNWNIPILRLNTQHRQDDPDFIAVLNDVRVGKLTPRVREFLDAHSVHELSDDCVQLDSTREGVLQANNRRLGMLSGKSQSFRWRVETRCKFGSEHDLSLDALIKRARFQHDLQLKVGAQVMMLTNTALWANGTTGEVLEMDGLSISVKLRNGSEVQVERGEEEVIDGNGNVSHVIKQFPMMLAWSITIHKSQGLTIDKLGVWLNNHFAPGMTYTALSRARRAADIQLAGYLVRLFCNQAALRYA